jgi:hypothetical protein
MSEGRLKVLVVLLLLAVGVLILERAGIVPSGVPFPGEPTLRPDGGDGPPPPAPAPLGPSDMRELGLPVVTTEAPDSAAGRQLAWAIAQLNLGQAGAAEDEYRVRFSESQLETLPAGQMRSTIVTASQRGPFALVGFQQPPTDTSLRAVVRLPENDYVVVHVDVESAEPFRMTQFTINDTL